MPVISGAEVHRTPFQYSVIKNFIRPEKVMEICNGFPELCGTGVFNCKNFAGANALNSVVEELKSEAIRKWLDQNFGSDLTGKPVMATLRGFSAARDGRAHTDSKDKIITILLYLNPDWLEPTGRLRLLRDNNVDNYFEEVSPEAGTCIIFKVADNSWHGYKQFVGQRRQIMFNYLVAENVAKAHKFRHKFSEVIKQVKHSLVTA